MDLLLVILGFSLIIVLHELGHFLAARWAGIRVLAFAVGFGSALVSFRKGLGLRFGSSEKELREHPPDPGTAVSPTEYRLNWLPFGGYVKMLGQEDLDPAATSDEPDSYQNCPPWKRMVVISAGVAMNLVTGALLFVGVFTAGLETEAPEIGLIEPGSPADRAAPLHAVGVERPGLQPGDRVLEVNGRDVRSFHDLVVASVMSRRDEAIHYTVERDDPRSPLEFAIRPEVNSGTGLREVGIRPPRRTRLVEAAGPAERQELEQALAALGWQGVEPGMELVRVGADDRVESPGILLRALRESGGRPFEAEFAGGGKNVTVTIQPEPEYQLDLVENSDRDSSWIRRVLGLVPKHRSPFPHLLGLTPLMAVGSVAERGQAQGLRDGDVFLRVGDVDYPSLPRGMTEIRSHRGRSIELVVLRQGQGGSAAEEVRLTASVSAEGMIGFGAEGAARSTILAAPPSELLELFGDERPVVPPAGALIRRPGTRIASVAGRSVADFPELRAALVEATAEAYQSGVESATVAMELVDPAGAAGQGASHVEPWHLSRADLSRLHSLRWTGAIGLDLFPPLKTLLQANGPVEALDMGVDETRQMIAQTYAMFPRLFQGTVKVEQLKGPIGIAHVGTVVAERGLIWLLFFMAMISINLAVINFLPLPIVDGGQFLFLLVEHVRGRPVSARIQQAVTLVGLVLIGAVFLFITRNDIVALVAGS